MQTQASRYRLLGRRGAALLRTDVSEKLIASIIRMKVIGELGTMLAVTSDYYLLCSYLARTFQHDDGGITFL
jgi:hypothetical protein